MVVDDGGDARGLADTLVALAEQIAAAAACVQCCIYKYLPNQHVLHAHAIWGEELSDGDRAWIGPSDRLADIPGLLNVVANRQTLISDGDAAQADATQDGPAARRGTMASIWAPIVSDDEVIGVLELRWRPPHVFDEGDMRLAQRLARFAALTLAHARDSRLARARNRQLKALIDSSRAMTSTLDLDEVLKMVCRQAAHALDTQASYIYLYEPESRTVIWLAEYQRNPEHTFEEPLGTVYAIDDHPQYFEVFACRRTIQMKLDDPDLDPAMRGLLLDWGETASLMAPLIVADEVVGALEVGETREMRHFSDEEVALCQTLGSQAAVAIRNAQLYRRLQEQKSTIEHQATTDSLTGLCNRRYLWRRLRQEVTRAKRYGHPLSLLMLDLDDFKSVNDRFGHPTGDRVLRAVGDVLKAHVRQDVDVPARFGGEEFAVMLPYTESTQAEDSRWDGAAATAERIRKAVAGIAVPVDGGNATTTTVSIGVATLPSPDGDAEGLVSRADKALYEAKRAGKDRVEVYLPPKG